MIRQTYSIKSEDVAKARSNASKLQAKLELEDHNEGFAGLEMWSVLGVHTEQLSACDKQVDGRQWKGAAQSDLEETDGE